MPMAQNMTLTEDQVIGLLTYKDATGVGKAFSGPIIAHCQNGRCSLLWSCRRVPVTLQDDHGEVGIRRCIT